MTRLPNLERALLEAAERLEPRRAWWERGAPLLAAAVLLGGGGTLTVAAGTGLLDRGDPVPRAAPPGKLRPGTTRVLSPRAADPDGGPPWAIGVYDITPNPINGAPAAATGTKARCALVARTQGGVLGVVGRDHLFDDDGRFHVLPPFAQFTGTCSGLPLLMTKGGAPTPASGYSGAPTTPLGGCRMYGPPAKATSSPQTRRKLRGIPRCSEAGKRIVKYGFAGRQATQVRFANDKLDLEARPGEDGAFLFVVRPRDAGPKPMRITVTYRDGTVCKSPGRTLLVQQSGPCSPPPGF